ncbi:threonine/serine exporter family protein, partial [Lacticaseibacillus paracasei]
KRMAVQAGLIGAVANTLRLELVDLSTIPPAAAAFIGALVAGLLASAINRVDGYPRISLTVPSIVIMVPGLYIYRAIYNIGLNNIGVGAEW